MPSNIEAEQAVLGSLLLSKEKYPEVDALINPGDFESEAHREIYECIKQLADEGKGIDHITVSKQLDRKNSLQRVGGVDYLKELQKVPVSALAADSYANLVKDQSIDRNLKKVLQEIIKTSDDPKGKTSDEILSEAEAKIFELSENRTKDDSLKKIEEYVGPTLDRLEELSKKQGELIGISSGFKAVDGVTQGLQKEDLIVIAGRPSMGKTSLAMNIAENVAKDEDGCVLVFSLEMSSESLTSRMLASMAGISQQSFKSANLTDRQWEKTIQQAKKLENMDIHIDDKPNISPMEIRAKARRLAKKHRNDGGVKLIVIDYIQLMQMPGRTENRVNELSDISRSLKYLAKEVNAPVIVLSQLNRAVEQRPNKRPQMADLRDSGAIEQDADLIFMLYRDYLYTNDEDWKNVVELRLVKHRNGPTKDILLSFRDELTRFGDLAPEIMNSYAENRTAD
ncbi:MAG: replicative DNA helicase [Amoebophilaceae bacterium TMED152]|nr:replicative DNA helicase [Gammaproteobacteria bacterium]RPH02050.1 MAG: replicative DNA helicase [Amoebophilaceae bacterium TMED152]|tara:strand:+ start:44 stop:1402 length:1359 start_codon:yes stop_codon:yes gene_type:complete